MKELTRLLRGAMSIMQICGEQYLFECKNNINNNSINKSLPTSNNRYICEWLKQKTDAEEEQKSNKAFEELLQDQSQNKKKTQCAKKMRKKQKMKQKKEEERKIQNKWKQYSNHLKKDEINKITK